MLRRPAGAGKDVSAPAGEAEPLPSTGTTTPPPPTAPAPAASPTAVSHNLAALQQTATVAPASQPAQVPPVTTIASTAVPTAAAAGSGPVPPVSRLIATKLRQQRRRKMLAWMTLLLVGLLFGLIAATLVGLSREDLGRTSAEAVTAPPGETLLNLFRVGPSQWKEADEMTTSSTRHGPLGFENYSISPISSTGDYLIVGEVVSSSFDLYDNARLQLMLTDGEQRIYARTDIALAPLSSHRETIRQSVSMTIPAELHRQFNSLEWDILPGQPMNDGIILNPARVTRIGSGKDTQIKLTYVNQQHKPIYKISIFLRARDDRGRTQASWSGYWRGTLAPDDTLELLVPAPLDESQVTIRDWQVNSAADLATAPLNRIPASNP